MLGMGPVKSKVTGSKNSMYLLTEWEGWTKK